MEVLGSQTVVVKVWCLPHRLVQHLLTVPTLQGKDSMMPCDFPEALLPRVPGSYSGPRAARNIWHLEGWSLGHNRPSPVLEDWQVTKGHSPTSPLTSAGPPPQAAPCPACTPAGPPPLERPYGKYLSVCGAMLLRILLSTDPILGPSGSLSLIFSYFLSACSCLLNILIFVTEP